MDERKLWETWGETKVRHNPPQSLLEDSFFLTCSIDQQGELILETRLKRHSLIGYGCLWNMFAYIRRRPTGPKKEDLFWG